MTQIIRNTRLPFIEIKKGAQDPYPVRHHSHEELSIGFVEQGSSRITCKSLDFQMDIDQVVLLPPDAIHLCVPEKEGQFNFLVFYIDTQWFASVFGFDTHKLNPQVAPLNSEQKKRKESFLDRFPEMDDPFIAESETVQFIGWLLFDLMGLDGPAIHPKIEPHQIQKVQTYLNEHFTEPIQLDELVRIYPKSKFSMIREFKKTYSLTPHAYLINLRINKAKPMLTQGESVAQTAVACGFFDQSHFVKVFRQYVGMNPSEYK